MKPNDHPEHLSPSLEVRENREFASEIKFPVPAGLGGEIRSWARHWLAPDPHAGGDLGDTYRTTSIYFDTGNFDVLQKTGSFAKSKYRIRRYGDSQAAFLERKLKTQDLVSKRRSVIDVADLACLGHAKPRRGWAGYWFHRRIQARLLSPVCQISYLRTARVGIGSFGPIRLTLDQDLRALPVSRTAFHHQSPGPPLSEHLILELKFRRSLPELFHQLIETFGLHPQSVSKYRLAASTPECVAGWVARAQPAAGIPSTENAA
jgi:hypothetical protein